jgi:hypothetical protein
MSIKSDAVDKLTTENAPQNVIDAVTALPDDADAGTLVAALVSAVSHPVTKRRPGCAKVDLPATKTDRRFRA